MTLSPSDRKKCPQQNSLHATTPGCTRRFSPYSRSQQMKWDFVRHATLLIYCAIASVLITPIARSQEKKQVVEQQAHLKQVLVELQRNEHSIVTCELRLNRYYYHCGDHIVPADPGVMFELFDPENAKLNLTSLTKRFNEQAIKWPDAPDPTKIYNVHYVQDGEKLKWNIYRPDGSLRNSTIFDGKLWLNDSGSQITLRPPDQGSFVVEGLNRCRYLPTGLLENSARLTNLDKKRSSLSIRSDGNEFLFNERGHCFALREGEPKVSRHIFQYFFEPEWEKFALPSVYIEITYVDSHAIGSAMLFVITEARFNQVIPPETFSMPVQPGRRFVDQRKDTIVPVDVASQNPDASQYANLPEADLLLTLQNEYESKVKKQAAKPWINTILLVSGAFFILLSSLLIIKKFRQRASRASI